MKTLRTVCLVCAGYYLLQALGLMFSSLFSGMVRDMMPASLNDHPLFQVQKDIASLMAAFGPYVLIGVVVCLLMAWRLKQLWKAIPLLSVLLFAGGMIWLLLFVQKLQVFNNMIARSMGDIPAASSGYLEIVTRIGNWSSAFPVLLPGVLIFIFWWRAQRGASNPSPIDSGNTTYS